MDTPSLSDLVGNTGEHTPLDYPRPEADRCIEQDVAYGAAHDGLKKSTMYGYDGDEAMEDGGGKDQGK